MQRELGTLGHGPAKEQQPRPGQPREAEEVGAGGFIEVVGLGGFFDKLLRGGLLGRVQHGFAGADGGRLGLPQGVHAGFHGGAEGRSAAGVLKEGQPADAQLHHQHADAEEEADVADPVDDDRLAAGDRGGAFFIPEADEEVAADPDEFPEHKELDQVVGEEQPKHGEAEQPEVGEEPGVLGVAGHVSDGEDVDHRGDGGHQEEHHEGQGVDHGAELDRGAILRGGGWGGLAGADGVLAGDDGVPGRAGGGCGGGQDDPLEGLSFHPAGDGLGLGRLLAVPDHQRRDGQGERREDGAGSHEGRRLPQTLAAKNKDQETHQRQQRGDEKKIGSSHRAFQGRLGAKYRTIRSDDTPADNVQRLPRVIVFPAATECKGDARTSLPGWVIMQIRTSLSPSRLRDILSSSRMMLSGCTPVVSP